MVRFLTILLLICMQFFMTGCVEMRYFLSSNTLKMSNDNRDNIIVDDIVTMIQGHLAPAKTLLYIDPDKSVGNQVFTNNIENRLREVGYGISREYKYRVTIPFSWQIDMLSESVARATYHIANIKITRLYKKSKGVYSPYGQFTTLGLGRARYKVKKLPKRRYKVQHKKKKLTYRDYKVPSKAQRKKPYRKKRVKKPSSATKMSTKAKKSTLSPVIPVEKRRNGFKNKIKSGKYRKWWGKRHG